MLTELIAKNFILIKELNLEFPRGFCSITGETGAGKSILIQALKLIMGDRASSDVIGPYAETATIQAIFKIDNLHIVKDKLEELDISVEEQELIIRRVISPKRSRVYLNGIVITLSDLKDISQSLISIEGQHAFQQLLNIRGQLDLLDRFADAYPIREKLLITYNTVKKLNEQLNQLINKKKKSNEYQEILSKEISEIESVNPKPKEDVELEQEIKVLKSAVELKEISSSAYNRLYSNRGSIYETISEVKADLARISDIEPKINDIFSNLEALVYQIEELSFSLRDYEKSLVIDPIKLEQKQTRLSDIKKLLRRYGPTIEDVLLHLNHLKEQLKSICSIDTEIEKTQKYLDEQIKHLLDISKELSDKRKKAAKELEKAVTLQLQDLNMGKCEFKISIKTPTTPCVDDVSQTGIDKIEFLFSSNPGLPPKPISQIASGGELSRLMLAIKSALAQKTPVETLVFDEIDAGIGGETAKKVGIKLKTLAQNAQVIVVTHFPQIAALSSHQYIVEKSYKKDSTYTHIRALSDKQRVLELARMLGTDAKEAKLYAEKLLREAKLKK